MTEMWQTVEIKNEMLDDDWDATHGIYGHPPEQDTEHLEDPLAIPSDFQQQNLETEMIWPVKIEIQFPSADEQIPHTSQVTDINQTLDPLLQVKTENNYTDLNPQYEDQSSKLVAGSFQLKSEEFVFEFTSNICESHDTPCDVVSQQNNSPGKSMEVKSESKVLFEPLKSPLDATVSKDVTKQTTSKRRARGRSQVGNPMQLQVQVICEHCDKPYQSQMHLVKHLNAFNCCKFCFKCFKTKTEVRIHQKTNHNISENSATPTCDMCKRKFESTYLKRVHMDKFSCIEKKCKWCGMKLESRLQYEKHIMDMHCNDKECSFCGYSFRIIKIARHFRRHTPLKYKAHLCKYCNVRYSTKALYKVHKCSLAKNLSCERCKFYFFNFQEQEEHIQVCRNMIIYRNVNK